MELRSVSVAILTNLALLGAMSGNFEEAEAAGERAVTLARRQGDPRIEGISETHLSISHYLKGAYVDAEIHAQAAISLLANTLPSLPAGLAALSQALLSQGRAISALEYGQRAHRMLEEQGRVEDGEALIRVAYARCLSAFGLDDEAAAVFRAARTRLEQRATRITNPKWREAFLTRPLYHAEIMAIHSPPGGEAHRPMTKLFSAATITPTIDSPAMNPDDTGIA
jgi:tetratricopeptide (TPR) repeat protein